MDIKLPHSLLTQFLKTKVSPDSIAHDISLCGPTVDRLHQLKNDTVYDIEIITNRIDSASAFGVAREAAAILPQFDHHAELKNNPYDHKLEDLGELPSNQPVKVQILDNSLVPRFTAIALSDIVIKDSPEQTIDWLVNSGQRSLNNVIDITNELTLKYGQPVHVFDLDKIVDQKLIVRESKKGERILTLDGRTHALKGGDIVIEDGAKNLIDLCGIIGGGLSNVDENTKNVLLFVQTYEPKHIRRTSLYTQERTLAAQIFEKSPDPQLVLPVLIEGVKLLQSRANAKIASNLLDIYPDPPKLKIISLNLSWLNQFIGIKISKTEIISILNHLGFKTAPTTEDILEVTVPSWRLNDVSIKEDLAEEITRIHGYFRLPATLPPTTLPRTQTDSFLQNEYKAKTYLANLGFTEVYNLALVSQDLYQKSGLNLDEKLKLTNPLSNEYEYLRPSLIPSLLQNLSNNRGKVETPLRLFELANTYHSTTKTLPDETSTLTFVTLGLSFNQTKGYLEALLKHLHLNIQFKSLKEDQKPFVTNQTAAICIDKDILGHLGVIDENVTRNFSLSEPVIIANLDFSQLNKHLDPIHRFKPVPQYASIFEDITLTSNQPVGDILADLRTKELVVNVTYLTSHENKHSFRLEFNDPKGNLTQERVNQLKSSLLDR